MWSNVLRYCGPWPPINDNYPVEWNAQSRIYLKFDELEDLLPHFLKNFRGYVLRFLSLSFAVIFKLGFILDMTFQ